MSNTKHTPGPWVSQESGNGTFSIIANVKGVIARVKFDPHYLKEKTHPFDVAQADAKLIAAAPELLEALTGKEEDPHLWAVNWLATLLRVCRKQEVYKAIVEDQGGDADSVGTMLMELDNLVISGNAAIKKATP